MSSTIILNLSGPFVPAHPSVLPFICRATAENSLHRVSYRPTGPWCNTNFRWRRSPRSFTTVSRRSLRDTPASTTSRQGTRCVYISVCICKRIYCAICVCTYVNNYTCQGSSFGSRRILRDTPASITSQHGARCVYISLCICKRIYYAIGVCTYVDNYTCSEFQFRLKKFSSGYACFDYEPAGHQVCVYLHLCVSIIVFYVYTAERFSSTIDGTADWVWRKSGPRT